MTRTAQSVVLVLSVGVLVGAIAHPRAGRAQEPQATFRARTDLIPVDVSVLDADRRPVRGLQASDFTVLENGRPRPIVAFSAIEIPSSNDAPAGITGPVPVWAAERPAEIVSNDLPAEGRLVAILFDRSIPAGRNVAVAQGIARAAVEALGPGDLAAVVRTSRFTNDGRTQGFTADRRLLLDAVESPFMGMTSAELNPSPVPGMDPSTTDCQCGLCVFETIGQVAASMRDAPRRRKSLLFIGSAITIQLPNVSDRCYEVVRRPRERMMRALETANVTVHSIDPVGPITTNLTAGYIVKQGQNPIERAKLPALYNQENARRLDNLRVLPAHTGGRLVANTNEPEQAVPAIFEESRAYYLLGFEPTAAANGTSQRIEVKVNRRGTTVQARRAFVVEPPARPPAAGDEAGEKALAAALEAPMAVRQLPVRVAAALFPEPGSGTATVLVLVGTSLPPAAGPRRLHVAAAAFDAEGRTVASRRQEVEVVGDPARTGIADRLLVRLALPPGRYELRAAVRDDASDSVGSVFSFVDVPRVDADAGAMSTILLRQTGQEAVPGDPTQGLLPFTPAVTRRFVPDDTLTAFVRVFAGVARGPVSITTRLLDTAGSIRLERVGTLEPVASGSRDYEADISLSGLAPGRYLLRVEASLPGHNALGETEIVVVRSR